MPNIWDSSINDYGQNTLLDADVLFVQTGGTNVNTPGTSARTRFDNLRDSVLYVQSFSVATQTLPGKATPQDASVRSLKFVLQNIPANSTHDIELISVAFGGTATALPNYTFSIWLGDPSVNTSQKLYDYGATGIKVVDFYSPATVYVSNPGVATSIYCLMTNIGAAPWSFNVVGKYRNVRSADVILPVVVPPVAYSGPPLAVVNVGVGKQFATPSLGIAALAAGGTMNIYDGSYYDCMSIPGALGAVTINGTGTDKVFYDGQGGVGDGYRLSYGKGIIHVSGPGVTIKNIAFWNGGGADNVGDGEAGVYVDAIIFGSGGTVTVDHCSFDNCENGVFCPKTNSGVVVTLNVTNCDFGYTSSNGVTSDGQSHDMYCQPDYYNATYCNAYNGSLFGNAFKTRSANCLVSHCWIKHRSGRCVDVPEGGQLSITYNTLTANPDSVANFIGYANENDMRGFYDVLISNNTIIGVRYEDTIWYGCPGTAGAGHTMTFDNTNTWNFVSEATPASFSIQSNSTGNVVGVVLAPGNGYTFVPLPTLPAQRSLPALSPPT